MENVILKGEGIKKRFSANGEPVLNGVDIAVYQGDLTVIMGASGSGKSTLLYGLSGMDKISAGDVIYRNQNISNYNENQMAKLRSEEFGFIFQQGHLVSNLTLFENILISGYLNKNSSEENVRKRAELLFKQMKVENAKDRFPSEVSGGEAQRAAIARAMIHEPKLIFADEPTGALNRKNSEVVLDLLTSLNDQGQSILMVTHDVHTAIRGTRILYLEDGFIISEFTLPPYTEDEKNLREIQLNKWLSTTRW